LSAKIGTYPATINAVILRTGGERNYSFSSKVCVKKFRFCLFFSISRHFLQSGNLILWFIAFRATP